MRKFVPSYYQRNGIVGNILARQSDLWDRLTRDFLDFEAQCTVQTATWGLFLWEKDCGMPIDLQLPLEERRARVFAKRRGYGSITKASLEAFGESFTGGKITVSLLPNTFTVVLKYASQVGIPSYQTSFEVALRELIPAHLAISFAYNYLLIQQVEKTLTITQLNQTQLSSFSPFS